MVRGGSDSSENGRQKKRSFCLPFFIVILALFFLAGGVRTVFAELLRTLGGKVICADAENSQLSVAFRHPATGEIKPMLFTINSETGFSESIHLSDLAPEEPVEIDYIENTSGHLLARRVARVRLSGPPVGLENYRKK
ncbi:MAG: hypothetical protein H6757_06500 [Candidatus Omnitrophica bacterium]|nr:hypothetical protein [Candidatus Omnitrophota bacterium]